MSAAMSNKMISLKRKTLLRKLESSQTPRIIVSGVTENKQDMEDNNMDSRSSVTHQERQQPTAKHFLQIPDQLSDDECSDSDEEPDIQDLILNELIVLKSKVQESQHDIRQLNLRTQTLRNDLVELRLLRQKLLL